MDDTSLAREVLRLDADRPLLRAGDVARALTDQQHLTLTDAAPGVTALVVRALIAGSEACQPVVCVAPDDQAGALAGDLRFHGLDAKVFPLADATPFAAVPPDRKTMQDRLAALASLATTAAPATQAREATVPPVWVVPATALLRKVVPTRAVVARSETVRCGQEIDRDALLSRLTQRGYLRVPLVEDPGTFGARGALLDVWPAGDDAPIRIDFDGDEVVSIKRFDSDSQRSLATADSCTILPAHEMLSDDRAALTERLRDLCDAVNWPSTHTRTLIDDLLYGRAFVGAGAFLPAFTQLTALHSELPSDAIVVLESPDKIAGCWTEELDRAFTDLAAARERPHYDRPHFYVAPQDLLAWLTERRTIALLTSALRAPQASQAELNLEALCQLDDRSASLLTSDQSELRQAISTARAASGHAGGLDPLITRIERWRAAGLRVVCAARTSTQAQRLGLMLDNRDIPAMVDQPDEPMADDNAVEVVVGPLARGVVAPLERMAWVTEEEIFGSRAHRRRKAKGKVRALQDLRALLVGDFVVHTEHGIGRYQGLVHRQVGRANVELIQIEYAGGDKLYLPVHRLNQIHKLRGAEGTPKVDRLGGQTFARTKTRARAKVRRIADYLVQLYALRQAARGVATAPIDDEYRAFEASFPFEETDDQARAIDEVAADLERERPMDRLVCGDVGFGKTEVALRAAFRVAMSGRQVAVLCPTTILAQQHQLTFSRRLADYPIEVATLSRFTPKKEQTMALAALAAGKIDVVIGTHRLLSKDVHFHNLGLLVVDEEQRFGVTHKERIKSLKANVDVLTLTATPIPRTLQMAITGLRDLSVINTPPADRRAVRTIVTRHEDAILSEAIARELARGGQVFFVHNRIEGLPERARLLQQLAPTARIAVAHGGLNERNLERTMLAFIAGEYDILCSTAIIENGLDIPRCNTIIIDRPDMFGMGQLYQLRGRVGRSKERGYCYLVMPERGRLTADALTRVEALARHSELGSGLAIASLDLDLRGAGDVVGAEQTGAIATVGFEMFCRMLDRAVHEIRGDAYDEQPDPELSFDVEALLPESYIADIGVRLSLYKRLAEAVSEEELALIGEEIEDRFGRPPVAAKRLLELMEIKVQLRNLRALSCEASSSAVTVHFREDAPIDPASLAALVAKDPSLRLTPDMRLTRKTRKDDGFDNGLQASHKLLRVLRGV